MMVLGIMDTLKPSLQFYTEWIRKTAEDIDIVPLSCLQQNLHDLKRCSGLVLTGGGDIHPKFYGREDAMPLVHDVNEVRDEFDFSAIRLALNSRLPVLGICRGMQVFNVARGGSMIPDVGEGIHRGARGSRADVRHGVQLAPGSILHSITTLAEGQVNSHHHQAVDRTGDGLRVSARSTDGLIEGLEWDDPVGKPFLMLVQWHPERMEDFESPFSRGLLEYFLHEVHTSTVVQTSP